jgi:hypothetical protein
MEVYNRTEGLCRWKGLQQIMFHAKCPQTMEQNISLFFNGLYTPRSKVLHETPRKETRIQRKLPTVRIDPMPTIIYVLGVSFNQVFGVCRFPWKLSQTLHRGERSIIFVPTQKA